MRKIFTGIVSLAVLITFIYASNAEAIVSVKGYYRKNGTYVAPHYRSDPDGIPTNNWSYPGNTNPITGKTATGNPDTYLQNYYGGGSSGVVSSYSPTIYTQPTQTQTVVQAMTSDADRQILIQQLRDQILALQLQLQIVLLQNQIAALSQSK